MSEPSFGLKLFHALNCLLTHVERGRLSIPSTKAGCADMASTVLCTLSRNRDERTLHALARWFHHLRLGDIESFGPSAMANGFITSQGLDP